MPGKASLLALDLVLTFPLIYFYLCGLEGPGGITEIQRKEDTRMCLLFAHVPLAEVAPGLEGNLATNLEPPTLFLCGYRQAVGPVSCFENLWVCLAALVAGI